MSSTPQTQPPPQPALQRGFVKQVLSGDTVVIRRGIPNDHTQKEKVLCLSYITAPKLAKRAVEKSETQDEPWAWEAREFLRKKLIGQQVSFIIEKNQKSTTNREYGFIYLGPDRSSENVNHSLVKEGLVSVRGDGMRSPPPELQALLDLQEEAKANKRGKYADDANPQEHVRNIKWSIDSGSMMEFVHKHEGKQIKAVIENVRDGSTVRAFLLPDFYYITLMMSGIRCPMSKLDSEGKQVPNMKVEFFDEAKFFTELRLLQQDVEILLESVNTSCFVGTIIHPKGNIAEELLKAGLASCLDWSIAKMKKPMADRLRQAEKAAKEKKLNRWKDWTPPPQISNKEFSGTVIEVINGDALMIRLPNRTVKKVFLASIKPPPRDQAAAGGGGGGGEENGPKKGPKSRPLYEVPWMFEAREFLRKKLIGKKVNVVVDYVQPARDSYPEKTCATVTIASVNIAETMVSKGLATVVRYRQDNDERASAYDSLLAAEMKAQKGMKGIHAKKDDVPIHRVNDYSGEAAKAKNLFPHLNRQARIEGIVEFVMSGSRLRIFLPRDSSLITFLLSGIEVRHNESDGVNNEEAALQFTKDKCMQRDVEIKVENMDRAGSFIGWLWVDGINLSVSLVEAGLAKIHFSGENSEFSRQLHDAKASAIAKGLWKYAEKEEVKEVAEEDRTVERRVDYKEVLVPFVGREADFFAQFTSQEGKLNDQQSKLNQELKTSPPLPGAFTPKKNELVAAKFVDDSWYRARVEKLSHGLATILYVDYGNRAEVSVSNLAPLPASLAQEKPFAQHFRLALVETPKDIEDLDDMQGTFTELVGNGNKPLSLNVEETVSGVVRATLVDPETKDDIAKSLISQGLLLVERRKSRRLQKLLSEYQSAEEEAKKNRRNIWKYGDIREDDDKEFGLGR